jgi:hypothetical protein
MRKTQANLVVVRRQTRYETLRERWVSPAMAKFRLKQAHAVEDALRDDQGGGVARDAVVAEAADFTEYEDEDRIYDDALKHVRSEVELGLPVKVLDRPMLPTFDFWNTAAVVVVGQDGLVANTAKYVGDTPIVAVNPDPSRLDGVLLPFQPHNVRAAVQGVLTGRFPHTPVTMAEASLNDGQHLLAFNDLFIGCKSHVSARYTLEAGGRSEPQSSSGVLVATGAGSTGWLSSVFNMAAGIARLAGRERPPTPVLQRHDRRLFWVVREPFISKQSGANLVAGTLEQREELILESLMPRHGVIFSDGMEADYLEFNSGTIARITIAKQAARLVTKHSRQRR